MRSESLYFLFSPATRIKGVGPNIGKALEKLLPAPTVISGGTVPIVRDLLFHLPVGIVDRRKTYPLREAPENVVATFVVTVEEHLPPKNSRYSKKPYKVICGNDTGDITLVFFNAREDYIKQALPVGQQRVISGRLEKFDFQLQMTHPDIIAPLEQLAEVQKPEAVYPLTVGITTRRIAKIVADALAKLPELPEWVDTKLLAAHGWPKWKEALHLAHHPQSEEDVLATTPARMRLAYDEILANQLHLALLRRNMQQQAGEMITGNGTLTLPLQKSLPFALTKGQQQVLAEINEGLASGKRMGRLLQGDVGSGKTIVALFAMLRAVEQGLQAALMVPTEIIASQHYETLSKMLASIPSPPEGEGAERSEAGEGWSTRGYKSDMTDNARDLRKNSTEVEKKLWNILRHRQLEQYKFRRHQPIGSYIVDFVCPDEMLVIELDGGQHAKQQTYDEKRTKFLEAQGYRVLRFWNNEVIENIEGVYDRIYQTLNTPHPALRATLSLKGRGVKLVLLTGSVKGKAREEALAAIASGEANIIIGTHALFQEHVNFANLALVIIDEQHRFGVNQRMALTSKGNSPHVLHMTATPIPRSLTLTLYGDMDISQLTEKPAGRQAITTRLIPLSRYGEVVERMDAALKRGEKAYWICPLIEESGISNLEQNSRFQIPDSDLAAAMSRYTEFKTRFGDGVGLVHGRMKVAERDKAMREFAEGKTRLLVATTVIEVGVDVKDATIMVVEQAERFGLAQLHQLRGRVGRGEKLSSCVLLYDEGLRASGSGLQGKNFLEPKAQSLEPSLARLSVLRETDDGFKIAEADLAQRGGGDVLGVRQSGLPRFIFLDFSCHQPLIEKARDDAKNILKSDPELQSERGKALKLLLQIFGYE